MRVTNHMMYSSSMVDINRNMQYLDSLRKQIETGKKLQVPSDDPIAASRALSFRNSVSEIAQFQRNIESGLAWMNVSEAAFSNILDNNGIMSKIRTRLVEAATGTETPVDKETIVAELRQLISQIGTEMNQTYAGRYVFSGYRTNQPPILTEDRDFSYVITQVFDTKNIEKTKSSQKLGLTDEPVVNNINVLKLAYKGADFDYVYTDPNDSSITYPLFDGTTSPYGMGIYTADGTKQYNVVTKNSQNTDAYTPADDGQTIYYIADTGELVFGNKVADEFQDGTTVTYEKNDYKKGELNPLVYFDCLEVTGTKEENVVEQLYLSSVSSAALDTAGMYNILSICNTGSTSNQNFYFTINGSSQVLASFDLGSYMAKFYNDNYAGTLGGTFNTFVAGMYTDPNNADYSLVPGAQVVFTDVLEGALKEALSTPGTLVSPLTAADANVTVLPDGRINIAYTFDSDSSIGYSGIACSPAPSTAFGHGFLHNAFSATVSTGSTTNTKTTPDIRAYTMDNQEIKYECSSNNYVTINSMAKNIYTDKMYADLVGLCEFVESLTISDRKQLEEYYANTKGLTGEDLTNAVNKQIADENAQVQAVLYDRFNNMLYLVDRHVDNAMKEQTQMGSRMERMNLLQSRLEEDDVSYTKLLSQNEDTNMVTALIKRKAVEAAYQASLKVTSTIMQLSLASFIG